MPYIKHEDGYEAATVNHGADSTLGGFDQLIRCRGHYPSDEACDTVLYAWVPDEDVCSNCTVVTDDEYDDFHSARTRHLYEHRFIPATEAQLTQYEAEATAAGEEIVRLEREKGKANAKVDDVLAATEQVLELVRLRQRTSASTREARGLLERQREELEQIKRDIATKGDSVRRRRLRQTEAIHNATGKGRS